MGNELTTGGAAIGTAFSPGLGTAIGAGAGYLVDLYMNNNNQPTYKNWSIAVANEADVPKMIPIWQHMADVMKISFNDFISKASITGTTSQYILSVYNSGNYSKPGGTGSTGTGGSNNTPKPGGSTGGNKTALAGFGGDLTMSIVGTVILAVVVILLFKFSKK